MAFLPSGRYAYLLTGGTSDMGNSGSLSTYRAGAGGVLTSAPASGTPPHENYYGNPDTVLADPRGRYIYVSTDRFLQEYAVGLGGALTPAFQLSGATAFPVSSGDGSLLFMLARQPGEENSPGYSVILETARVDGAGHLTPRRYWVQADGSFQLQPIPESQWARGGICRILCSSPDGRTLYALRAGLNFVKPLDYSCVYSFKVDPATGALTASHPLVKVPNGACMTLVAPQR